MVRRVVAMVLAVGVVLAGCSPEREEVPPQNVADALKAQFGECPEQPGGLIGKRWLELGGKWGALGCPTGPERPVGRGRVQSFAEGELAWSPDQGSELVVAAYKRGKSIAVNWRRTTPYAYQFFLVRWDLNDVNVGQQKLQQGRTPGGIVKLPMNRGWFTMNPGKVGRYTFRVEGCDNGGTFSGSKCRQGWTIPVSVQTGGGGTRDGVPTKYECAQLPVGLIGDRWRALGADRSPLGCPTGPEQPVAGRPGARQSFERGEIVWSPQQGAKMMVAAYLLGNRMTVEFGPTDPYSYDRYLLRLGRNGTHIGQYRLNGSDSRWSSTLRGFGTYSMIVQGCDTTTFSGLRCRQKWTIPVHVRLTTYAGSPSRCSVGAASEISQRWHELRAWDGPLGCPTGRAERNPGGVRGVRQAFEGGEMAWSPRQGRRMVVAAYQQAGHLFVDWGLSAPYHYGLFLIRSGVVNEPAKQAELIGARDQGTFLFSGAGAARYSVRVEGCDRRNLQSSRCRQGWTIPVRVTGKPAGEIEIKDVSHNSFGTPDAKEQKRIRRAAEHWACNHPVKMDGWDNSEDHSMTLFTRLVRAKSYGWRDHCPGELPNVILVNEALRWTRPGALGTHVDLPVCTVHGDYDAFLKGLVSAVYRFPEMVNPDVHQRVRTHLLNVSGPHDPNIERKVLCGFAMTYPETENHLLMIESSRYLANQLRFRDTRDASYHNTDNGMEDWLLGFLQTIAKHDFLEYNSRSYQRYSMHALINLADLAESPRMRTAARILLDYTTTKFAVSSNMLRRAGPFRRLRANNDIANQSYFVGGSDPQTMFFLAWTGQSEFTGGKIPASWAIETTIAGIAEYRPPRAAQILATDKSAGGEHRFYHGQRPQYWAGNKADGGVEIYASSPSFLITAGGVWVNSGMTHDEFRSFKDVGMAQSTTLMPTKANKPHRELLRFEGYRTSSVTPIDRTVINTCVSGGFACGVQLKGLEHYASCTRSVGKAWRFIDGGCTKLGYHVAVHISTQQAPQYETVGFFHAREANIGIDEFQSRTLDANRGLPDELTVVGTYEFVSADGERHKFRLHPNQNKYDNRIYSGPAIRNWPLVSGPFLESRGHDGYFKIRTPKCPGELILDFSDVDLPIRLDPPPC